MKKDEIPLMVSVRRAGTLLVLAAIGGILLLGCGGGSSTENTGEPGLTQGPSKEVEGAQEPEALIEQATEQADESIEAAKEESATTIEEAKSDSSLSKSALQEAKQQANEALQSAKEGAKERSKRPRKKPAN